MRTPIAVNVKPFDLDPAQPRIEAVRDAFSQYLDRYIPKSSRSKYGLMGPVGKILNEARSGRSDPDFLKGYVLRVHELSQKGLPSPEAIKALEKGINLLTQLLREIPITVHDRLIDRLDHGLYFARRKRFLEWLDQRNRDFCIWLQQNYPGIEAVSEAWGRQIKDWDQVRYAGPSSRTYKEGSPRQRKDMDAFTKHLKEVGKTEIADIDTEEEIA